MEEKCLEEGVSFSDLPKDVVWASCALPSGLSLGASTWVCKTIQIIMPEVRILPRAIKKLQFV